mmetsp:Transcript_36525/g.46534  ORF Transcript_36525/g.46534 Transcript_36525/m.46534 type:complete len:241 (+) Transcript_36525:141-863(+)|eukprot:CAMPEP_0117784034 /NCGR_PEP_ID=MMETSP0948-20121206/4408_1 /TAXON_ID=44440 /ORGANISM="Chattonella subsalsa, Strain CCMP2191" /LENGTH=240 /DNA_ID=CAMNT_0005612593 /DNA_START=37 /DNA_END=759 /DNA_ORIENTATION=+
MYVGTGYAGSISKNSCNSPVPLALEGVLQNLPSLPNNIAFSSVELKFDSSILQSLRLTEAKNTENQSISPYCTPHKDLTLQHFHQSQTKSVRPANNVSNISIKVSSAKLDITPKNRRNLLKYQIHISASGRCYSATRRHCDVAKLVEKLQKLGYSLPVEIPDLDQLFSFSRPLFPCQLGGSRSVNYDYIEECRKDMEYFLQELLNMSADIEFQMDVQSFLWEPISPRGCLDSIAESWEEE